MPRASTNTSPYYPPRARWYGRLFSPWRTLMRLLRIERIRFPDGLSPFKVLVSLILPGASLGFVGRPVSAVGVAGIYVLALAVFIVGLGYPISGWSYAVLISVHSISILFLLLHWLRFDSLGLRVVVAALVVVAVWLLIYAPLVGLAQRYWLPMRFDDRVYVVSTRAARDLRAGDLLAYSVVGRALTPGVFVRTGVDLAPVLAVAGDVVSFQENAFSVNGVPMEKLPHMPSEGELVVPENNWFVWPNLDIRAANVAPSTITAALLDQAVVSREQFAGRPFRHWFWRRQEWKPPT